jgi:IS1 family transposase
LEGEAGDFWIWVATDADTKLVPHWRVGPRDIRACYWFIHDLAGRIEGRFQLTTDGFPPYREAVELGVRRTPRS